MNKFDYLTEQELIDLIASAEAKSYPNAPEYLKEQILQKSLKAPSGHSGPLLVFSAKVIAAAAASIALLFGMTETSIRESRPQNFAISCRNENSFSMQLNEKTNQFLSLLTDTTNSIFLKEDEK